MCYAVQLHALPYRTVHEKYLYRSAPVHSFPPPPSSLSPFQPPNSKPQSPYLPPKNVNHRSSPRQPVLASLPPTRPAHQIPLPYTRIPLLFHPTLPSPSPRHPGHLMHLQRYNNQPHTMFHPVALGHLIPHPTYPLHPQPTIQLPIHARAPIINLGVRAGVFRE